MKSIYIYTLLDPRNGQVNYVGKTINPKLRFRTHLKPSSLCNEIKKNVWIKSLLQFNLKPELSILEKVTMSNWQQRERYWIKFYRKQNPNLTNTTSGGAGVIDGAYFSPEARRKISLTHKGNKYNLGRITSEEAKNKIRESLLGNQYAKGFKHSKETRRKVQFGNQKSGISKKNTSGYRGVSFITRENLWVASINFNKVQFRLGYFKIKEEAALAYDKKALELFGSNCYLNFPKERFHR